MSGRRIYKMTSVNWSELRKREKPMLTFLLLHQSKENSEEVLEEDL